MPQAYDSLAEWFEYLNDDCDYEKWSQYFIRGLSRLGAGKKGLEIGCGSGYFCRALAKEGYAMTGTDISAPMLAVAAKKAREAGVKAEFVLSDVLRLHTPERYDFAISPNDCFNYIPQGKLLTAFRRVASCLKKDGIFWFDISSAGKLRGKVADNIFADDRDEVTYLCFGKGCGDCVEMDVTLFVRQSDGRFVRSDEKHIQYIHEEENVLSALCDAGFEPVAVEGHLGEEKAGSDRLNFICRRK